MKVSRSPALTRKLVFFDGSCCSSGKPLLMYQPPPLPAPPPARPRGARAKRSELRTVIQLSVR
jgi:hypothetical protein